MPGTANGLALFVLTWNGVPNSLKPGAQFGNETGMMIRKYTMSLRRRSRSLVSRALDIRLGLVRNRLTHVDARKRL